MAGESGFPSHSVPFCPGPTRGGLGRTHGRARRCRGLWAWVWGTEARAEMGRWIWSEQSWSYSGHRLPGEIRLLLGSCYRIWYMCSIRVGKRVLSSVLGRTIGRQGGQTGRADREGRQGGQTGRADREGRQGGQPQGLPLPAGSSCVRGAGGHEGGRRGSHGGGPRRAGSGCARGAGQPQGLPLPGEFGLWLVAARVNIGLLRGPSAS